VGSHQLQPKAFSTTVQDDILTVTLYRDFDSGRLNQDWGQFVVASHPGPFAQVRLDLAQCGRLNSTFIAGLIRLYAAYAAQGTQRVVLVAPDKRLLANLKMLRFDQYFIVA
jgi:ABC-type transporter Mla MlaB component